MELKGGYKTVAKIFASRNKEIDQREINHMVLSRQVATECMVLLENDGTLPIKVGKVALYGNGARGTIKGGTSPTITACITWLVTLLNGAAMSIVKMSTPLEQTIRTPIVVMSISMSL